MEPADRLRVLASELLRRAELRPRWRIRLMDGTPDGPVCVAVLMPGDRRGQWVRTDAQSDCDHA